MSGELPTIDRDGVEVMRAGGPVRGFGSPPEGEFISTDELQKLADATNEVIDELRPYGKLAHSDEQGVLRRSFFTDGEMPALGYYRNFRVEGDRLLADVKKLPAKFDQLVRAGAYRFRSAETKGFESQKTGKRYENVIRAIAWLGAQTPAIRTLDDVVALYAEDERVEVEPGTHVYVFAEEPEVEPEAEPETAARVTPQPSDSKDEMAEENVETGGLQLTEEQAAQLAQALGVEGELTAEMLLEAAQPVEEEETVTPVAETQSPGDEEEEGNGDNGEEERTEAVEEFELVGARALSDAEYYDLVRKADAGEEAASKLRKMERDTFLVNAAREGRFDPAKLKQYGEMYDENEDLTRRFIDGLEPRKDYADAFGSDTDGAESFDETLYADFNEFAGITSHTGGKGS